MADGGGLLRPLGRKTVLVGSNPTPSAFVWNNADGGHGPVRPAASLLVLLAAALLITCRDA